MSPQILSLLAFLTMLAGAFAGMLLRSALPQEHLANESKEIIKLGTGLVGTMAALVLGLLVASAKGSYDAQNGELVQMSANVIVLDRVLAHYGSETKQARELLRDGVINFIDQTWAKSRRGPSQLAPMSFSSENLYEEIEGLTPKTDLQRSLQNQALNLAMDVKQERSLMYEQATTSVSMPLLVVVVSWLTMIFIAWSLLASPNTTIKITILLSALSVSSALFLILEMYSPYRGWIQVSQAPIRAALTQLGQ